MDNFVAFLIADIYGIYVGHLCYISLDLWGNVCETSLVKKSMYFYDSNRCNLLCFFNMREFQKRY